MQNSRLSFKTILTKLTIFWGIVFVILLSLNYLLKFDFFSQHIENKEIYAYLNKGTTFDNEEEFDQYSILWNLNTYKLKNNGLDNGYSVIWKYADDEKKLPNKGNKKRILVVGDSYVWGVSSVNSNLLFWQQLRNMLSDSGYDEVEIIAIALSGLNTYQEYLALKIPGVIEEVDPDLIIFAAAFNDVIPANYDLYDTDMQDFSGFFVDIPHNNYYQQVTLKLSKNYDFFRNEKNIFIKISRKLFPNLYKKISNIIIKKYQSNETFILKYGFASEYYSVKYGLNNKYWLSQYKERSLRPIVSFMKNNLPSVKYFFFPLYTVPDEREKEIFDPIENLYDELGITYHSILDEFIKKYPTYDYNDGTWNSLYDYHPGSKTHYFYASKIYDILITQYQNILGKQKTFRDLPLEINETLPYLPVNAKKINNTTYTFTYPENTEVLLDFPIDTRYIKFNLKYPKKIKRIEIIPINKSMVNSLQLWTNQVNKNLGYDDAISFIDWGKQTRNFNWEILGKEEITSINLHADIRNGEQTQFQMKIYCED